ncbi:MAG: amidohydrolase family protein [Chloroflexi bacterium]|nr:amidohydrolase family protein [Chloroflexota bacterium]
MQPPLRAAQQALDMREDQYLADVISTDHCDYTLAQKQEHQDFSRTPGGLPGLETALQLVFTYSTLPVERRVQHIATRMALNPARIFGLYPRKGAILPGSDADLVIYDPQPTVTVEVSRLHTIGGYSPYEGFTLQGQVQTTISRGEVLVHEGIFTGGAGRGKFLKAAPFAGLKQ